jgi:hypothetical protein
MHLDRADSGQDLLDSPLENLCATQRIAARGPLERMRDTLAPGGRVLRARPLGGGVSSIVHSVSREAADGAREAAVVRRYGDYLVRTDPAACEREFRLLTILVFFEMTI